MSEPIHVLSLGAGVQSSTLALMAAVGEVTPMPKAAIFADTQDEPDAVYEWLGWLAPKLPFPVVTVSKGKLSNFVTTTKRRKDGNGTWSPSSVPAYTANFDGSKGHMNRGCTFDFKVMPLIRKCREIGGIKRGQKTIGVISWIGISLDEAHRMKPSREPWIEHRWPLIEKRMTRANCLRWMKDKGYPTPPRSACEYCPYHSDAEWKRLSDADPQFIGRVAAFEKRFQEAVKNTKGIRGVPFLHKSRVPIDKVDFDPSRNQPDLFGNECEGMCGV